MPFNENDLTFTELLRTLVEAGECFFDTICYLNKAFP